jgi:hypothetical protein
MSIPDGPYFDRRARDWVVYVDGNLWRDDADEVRHFLTADEGRDAAEDEVYRPRREAKRRPDETDAAYAERCLRNGTLRP